MSALPSDLLLRAGRRSALPWVIAAAAFLMALAAASALALGRSADAIAANAAGKITVSIAEGDPARRDAAAARALAILAGNKLVDRVARVDQAEVHRLVSPYLGADADIPLPALIDADLRPGVAIGAVRTALRAVSSARVDAEGEALAPLSGLIVALRRLALVVVLLSALVALLVTAMVARAALAAHAGTVETLHGLGATDAQLARLVERRTAMDALVGATLGLIAAGGVILIVGAHLGTINGSTGGAPHLPVRDWGLLMVLPVYLAGSAMMATRLTILSQLRRSI
ncbi:hypothetical protein Q4F19_18165 [Sphingomonas sp. BIUV-7]|uniref:Cell division transport system permease protein n=1 Tax=Sphingomonas natans TaxID=3063330 RepID=A0ABT8YD72_9SPHN|nr:hypothetical protein [Sphingomonas sp. BIUV-7]MDO6416316.1 hypothetical protein [Sphingomonas sp. BIUV-7]